MKVFDSFSYYIEIKIISKGMQAQKPFRGDSQAKANAQSNYYSQLKFMSIKSIMKNKKIIIKKTVPSNMFRNTQDYSLNEPSLFHSRPTDQSITRGELCRDAMFESEKERSCSQKNTMGQKGVVTIKFGQQGQQQKAQKQQKNRRKLFAQTVIDDIKRNISEQKQLFNERNNIMPFRQTLIVEPYRKNNDNFLEFIETKKNKSNFQLPKKSRKCSFGMTINSNRTISDFKSAGKQISIEEQKSKKWSRKIATAFQKRQNKQTIKREKQRENENTELLLKQYKQLLQIRKPANKKDHFVFGMSDKIVTEAENKIQLYRDFLWKINYSNAIYVCTPETIEQNYKAYVGQGNNSCMLKSILRRRFWWSIIEDKNQIQNANFVWTQLKMNNYFKLQEKEENKLPQRELLSEKGDSLSDDEYDRAHKKIFNEEDMKNWQQHLIKNQKTEEKLTEQTYLKRLNLFMKKDMKKILDSSQVKVHNHLNQNYYIGNKKALFYNFKKLCELHGDNVFKYLPVTFHVCKGIDDPVYLQFLKVYEKMEEIKKIDKTFRNIWIAKPGQNTNQGNGISVCFGLDDVRLRLRGRQKNFDGKMRTFILQKYIERPFLYKSRKFDIRHYALVTCFNGVYRAYWYQEGYIRTSSSIFNLKNMKDTVVHLTNDAVQKRSNEYGKFQKGNKLSYEDFQKYLSSSKLKKKHNFFRKALPRMKEITKLAISSTYSLLDVERRQHNFELLGLDFMLDENFNPWLIQVNTNPCLQLCCPLLQRIIPNMIEQTFRICVDPFFPPPENWTNSKKQFFGDNTLLENKFELIFDEKTEGHLYTGLHENDKNIEKELGKIEEDGDTFEDNGNDKWEAKMQL